MQKVLLRVLFFLSLTGCTNFVEDLTTPDAVRQRAEFAIPLVDSRVGLAELLGDVDERIYLTVDPDGLFRFNYSDTVPPVDSKAIFEDIQQLARGVPIPITQRRTFVEFPLPDDASLDILQLKAGRLAYYLPNPYDRPVQVTLTLPNLIVNGAPFTVSRQLPANSGSGTVPALTNNDAPIDLAGSAFEVTNDELEIDFRIDGLDGTELEPGRGTIAIFTNLTFSYLEGYFGRLPYPGADGQLAIDLFDDYTSGQVSFEEPRIIVRIRNSVGVPARALVEELTVLTADGRSLPVEGEIVDDGFTFGYPEERGANSYTTYIVDKNNSNIQELLDARPVALNYRISALINPDANANLTGFVSDTSSFSATVTLELPLFGSASDFAVSDTVRIDLGDRYGEVTAANFRVTTDNELPLDLNLTGTFIDSLGTPLADLSDGNLLLLKAGDSATNDIEATGERLARIREASFLVLETAFATADGGTRPVRVTEDQNLRVRIGARLTVDTP